MNGELKNPNGFFGVKVKTIMALVSEEMAQAGRDIASILADVNLTRLIGRKDWNDLVPMDYPNRDLVSDYFGGRIDSVIAIYIAMDRERSVHEKA